MTNMDGSIRCSLLTLDDEHLMIPVWSKHWRYYLGMSHRRLSPQRWLNPMGGKTPWKQNRSSCSLDDLTWDRRVLGTSKMAKARLTQQCLQGQNNKLRHLGRGKGLQGPVEVQPIMSKTLWGQKMDSKSPGGLSSQQTDWGVQLQEQKAEEAKPQWHKCLWKGPGW
jgi:hypothetical protein